MRFHSANFQANDFGLTLQHIALVNGKTTPTEMIPTAPAPCSQGWNDGEGGALYMRDGYLVVIDSIFTNNQAAPLGPDTGGGAIYVLGSKGGVWIAGSTFTNNQGSNAGAVGGLFAELNIYNSLFRDNDATGRDANGNEPEQVRRTSTTTRTRSDRAATAAPSTATETTSTSSCAATRC